MNKLVAWCCFLLCGVSFVISAHAEDEFYYNPAGTHLCRDVNGRASCMTTEKLHESLRGSYSESDLTQLMKDPTRRDEAYRAAFDHSAASGSGTSSASGPSPATGHREIEEGWDPNEHTVCQHGHIDDDPSNPCRSVGEYERTPYGQSEEAQECQNAYERAVQVCDNPLKSVFGEGDLEFVGRMLSADTLLAVGNTGGFIMTMLGNARGNHLQTCERAAMVSKMLMGMNGGYGAACTGAAGVCESKCGKAANSLHRENFPNLSAQEHAARTSIRREVASNAGNCARQLQKAQAAFAQVMNAGMSLVGSEACKEAAKTLAATNEPFCAKPENKQSPVCQGFMPNCDDPKNAGNQFCICQKNPRDPNCLGGVDNPGGGYANAPGSGVGSFGSRDADPFGDLDFGEGNEITGPESGSNKATASSGSAPGGPPLSSGGGGGGGGRGGGRGEGKGPFKTNIDQGVSGGSVAGVGFRGAGAYRNGSGRDGKGKGKKDLFNLKKFLPGGKKDPKRGLAGMSLRAKDGVTGPAGPSIWVKVSKQYRRQSVKLKH